MKRYEVQFWEKETVWVKRTIEIPTDKDFEKLSNDEKIEEIETNEDVDWLDGDYNWETSEIVEYDFENDFKVKEVK